VSVEGRGFNLFWPGLMAEQDSLPIDLERGIERGFVTQLQLEKHLQRRLPRSVTIRELQPDTILLQAKATSVTQVPVLSRLKLSPRKGYRFTSPPRLEPDSVKLIGTKQELDEQAAWPTQLKSYNDLHDQRTIAVPLERSDELIVSPKTVTLQLRAEKFTSFQRTLAIEAKNLPFDREIRFFPPKVEVHYLVPFDKAEQYRKADLSVTVDAGELSPENYYAMPSVTDQPEGVRGIRIVPNHVEYVIRQRKIAANP
jgi:hypothetical protein